MHISVQILSSHRTRNIAGPQFNTERLRQRPTRPKDALRVQRVPCTRANAVRDLLPGPVLFAERKVIRLVDLDAALHRSVFRSESQHPSNRGRNEQITLDVPQTPDKELEPPVVLDGIGAISGKSAISGKRAISGKIGAISGKRAISRGGTASRPRVRMMVPIQNDQS